MLPLLYIAKNSKCTCCKPQYKGMDWINYVWFNLKLPYTINPQKTPAGLIISLRVKMRALLKFGYFCLLFFKFTAGIIGIRVLLEGESLSRIYGSFILVTLCASLVQNDRKMRPSKIYFLGFQNIKPTWKFIKLWKSTMALRLSS